MSKVNRTVLHSTVPTVQNFIDGGTVRTSNDLFYHHNGTLWKCVSNGTIVVPPNSNPETLNETSHSVWVNLSGGYVLDELNKPTSTNTLGGGSLSRYKKVGSFSDGAVLHSTNDAILYSDGMYYINPNVQHPYNVVRGSVPDSTWICVGELGFFPTNYALNFGISSTGDMTDKVRKLHQYCNYSGEVADYYNVPSMSICSTAEISIQSDVDFRGADVLFIQSELRPEWEFIPAFRVLDPLTPLETIPNDWEPETLYADRTTIKNNSYEFSEGVICFDTNINFGKRYPTDSVYYKLREVFKVFKGGILNYPIDISIAGGDLGSVLFRKQPNKYLTIKDINIDSSNAPQLQAFSIERNKCNLVGFDFKNNTTVNKSRTIVYLNKVCDIHLSKWSGSGFEGNSASYLLGGDFVANMSITDFGIDGGMPAIGMNVVNGVDVENSHINRFDVHSFLHNVFIDNVTFGVYGVTYGVGGGTLSVKNSTFIKGKVPGRGDFVSLSSYNLLTARGDYGGVFYGNIVMDNITVKIDTRINLDGVGSTYPYNISAIAFASTGDYGFLDKKPFAYTISVSDIKIQNPSYKFFFDFTVLNFGRGLSTGSVFPSVINISDINFINSPLDNHHIIPISFPTYSTTFCNLDAGRINGNAKIKIKNIISNCSRARVAGRMSIGLNPTLEDQSDVHRLVPMVEISDSTGVYLTYSVNGGVVRVNNCEIRDFSTFSGGGSTPDIQFNNCKFYFVDGSQSQVGNCYVYNSHFSRQSSSTNSIQFGGVKAVQGCTLGDGINLINGGISAITKDSVFSGYKA